jgi:ribosome-associated protein
MPISIGELTIPDGDYSLAFVRASGPGGQNVNKVSSAVQLRFDLAGTQVLPFRVKARLRALAGRRVLDDGSLLILARNHRTQEANRREAEGRLAALIEEALVEPKVRRATRPTLASKKRRIEGKVRRSGTKAQRGKIRFDD